MADGMPGSLKDVRPPVEHYNWSGLYFGAGGGFSHIDRSGGVHTDRKKDTKSCEKGKFVDKKNCTGGFAHDGTVSSTLFSSFDDDDWSGFGTLQVGYDRQIHNHLIIGAFADVDFYDGDGGFDFADGHGRADLDWVWSVGGRLGVLAAPHLLLYGVAGYSEASLDTAISVNNGPTFSNDDRLEGWFIGAGVEKKVRDRRSLKLEYRYADYGSTGASGSSFTDKDHNCKPMNSHKCVDDETTKTRSDLDLEVQSIRALVVFRLDEHREPIVPLK
jgi:opacity protein-like surface antigen